MNEIRNRIQKIKKEITEIEKLINVKLFGELPSCYIANELQYVNLAEGSTDEKLERIVKQIVQHKINIINNHQDSALIRCAIIEEFGENGLKMWLQIRSLADNYKEEEQVRKYQYLLDRREKINLNFGVIVNRYKAAIDNYNKSLYQK